MTEHPRILVLQHDAQDPPERLGQWLTEVGAELDVREMFAGAALPALPGSGRSGTPDAPAGAVPPGDPADRFDHAAVVCLGGTMSADRDDATAPWLPGTRRLLADAVGRRIPAWGICLGAQLLAVATGGRVAVGADGPEIGAHLTAKRDAAATDPLFGELPMTPDVFQHHDDVVAVLPPGAVLLLSGMGYPNQAFRIGPAGWGLQGHIEPTAARVRQWSHIGPNDPIPTGGRLGPMLDEAEELIGQVWREVAHRFVAVARTGIPEPTAQVGRRLPLAQP